MLNKQLTVLLILVAALMFVVSSSPSQMKGKMGKYLVIGEFIDPGAMMSPSQGIPMMDNAVLPSLDMLAKWEADKKITGGIYVGERKGVFVVEAESNEEVDKMIQSLPFWGLLKWTVSPLHTFAGRAAQDKMNVEKMKSMMK